LDPDSGFFPNVHPDPGFAYLDTVLIQICCLLKFKSRNKKSEDTSLYIAKHLHEGFKKASGEASSAPCSSFEHGSYSFWAILIRVWIR
jgi:hypothetical protein